MLQKFSFISIMLIIYFSLSSSYAAIPNYINYTGKLTDPNTGQPLTGNYNITFSLYNVSSGGVAIWTEVQSVTVTSGFFSVLLGEGSSGIPTDVFSPSGDRYLEVQIDASPPMTPRQKLVSTAYAFEAQVADSARWAEANDWGDHALAGYLTAETDPDFNDSVASSITEVDTTNWNEAYSWGNHADEGYMSSESDPEVGSNTTSMIPRWNGSALVAGSIFDNGSNIGIGNSNPQYKLDVNGDLRVIGNDIFGGSSNLKLSPGNGFLEVKPSSSSYGMVLREYNSNDYGNFEVTGTGLGIGYNTDSAHMTINGSGYVGIGTTTPRMKMDVDAGGGAGIFIGQSNVLGGNEHDFEPVYPSLTIKRGSAYRGSNIALGNGDGYFYLYADDTRYSIYGPGSNYNSSALYNLNARGDVVINGHYSANGGNVYAHPFNTIDNNSLEAGDVVIIDPSNSLNVMKSNSAFDRTVIGIVTSEDQTGFISGTSEEKTYDKPIALVGHTLCNVTNENGPIKIGDLLTTSSKPGHAMRVDDYSKAFGAVIGKALEAFDAESGQIKVLVALQ